MTTGVRGGGHSAVLGTNMRSWCGDLRGSSHHVMSPCQARKPHLETRPAGRVECFTLGALSQMSAVTRGAHRPALTGTLSDTVCDIVTVSTAHLGQDHLLEESKKSV